MECQKVKENLYQFIDGELDEGTILSVKEHILSCPLCTLILEKEKRIDFLIKQNIPKVEAPFALKEAILDRIEGFPKLRLLPRSIKPRYALVSILAGLLLITSITPLIIKKSEVFPVFSESIKDHIQSLQGSLFSDITSNKSEEVHNWLQTKLDFKVMVPDLSSQGVNLVGARLRTLKDKKVAYIMYGRDEHKISVFMFDAKGLKFPKAKKIAMNNKIFHLSKEKGYNSALWIEEGIACVFVSDLGEAELLHLASL